MTRMRKLRLFVARCLFLILVFCAIGIVIVSATANPLDLLETEVRAQLTQLPDQLMKADCWQQGGHGSGAATTDFNSHLPTALAVLLKKPGLAREQIESLFFKETGQPLTLIEGDDHVFLGAIQNLDCPAGSHDRPFFSVYVLDRSGNYWKIGIVNSTRKIQWVEDRWIGTVDVSGQSYYTDELWVISRQDKGWVLSDKPLHVDDNQSMTYSLKDSYHTLIATVTTIRSDAPCEAIQQMNGYLTNFSSVTYTDVWFVDHYALVSKTQSGVTVTFLAEQYGKKPDLSAVKATPFYANSKPSPFAYWVDNWQALCK